MSIDYQKLRLDGIYQQDKNGHLMLRVKIPGWLLTPYQAREIGYLAKLYGQGILHLTSRCSIELHWLKQEYLEPVLQHLAAIGLTSRGAGGSAIRGISCSTAFTPGFATVQQVARKIHAHLVGRACYEGLPKKIKIGIETSYQGGRHLIQDIGLVLSADRIETASFDFWCAGGLGREPQAGFLLERTVAANRLLPLIEAVVQVYKDHTPPSRRLKFLVNQIGEEEFRRLVHMELGRRSPTLELSPIECSVLASFENILTVPLFAGEIRADYLHKLAELAQEVDDGFIAITADQNIALPLANGQTPAQVHTKLLERGVLLLEPRQRVNIRVCPGNHECRMGLSPTREVAGIIVDEINKIAGERSHRLTWAISGCPNGCSQPQLADFGIVTKKLITKDDGCKKPFFELYRRDSDGLGRLIAQELCLTELLQQVRQLVEFAVE